MNDQQSLLEQVRDVDVPVVAASIAPGLFLIIGLLLLACIVFWLLRYRRRQTLWQRQAQAELDDLRSTAATMPSEALVVRSSALCRQVLLAVDHREDVASLLGDAWLDKLDKVCGTPEFSQGVARLLVDYPYQREPEIGQYDRTALLDSVQVLINAAKRHKPAAGARAQPVEGAS